MSATTATTTTTSSTTTASATCVSMAPGKDGYLPPEACDSLLLYVPSFAAAVLFVVLFGLTTIAHIAQGVAYKKPFTWVITMGAIWEIGAMVMAALLAKHQNSDTYDTVHQVLFLLAPLWINAFLYMTLGRMVWFFDETKRLGGLSAQRFGSLFVWLDVISFLVQAAGALLSSSKDASDSTVQLGLHLYMAGIGIQEFFIVCFTGLLVILHRRLIRQEQRGVMLERLNNGTLRWRWLFYGMYFALAMITIRIIFRLAEYARGTDVNNPVLTHEAYVYVFDATPMFLALVALNILHPGRILSGPDASWPRLSRKEKKELKRQRKAEKKARKDGLLYTKTTDNDSNHSAEELTAPAAVEQHPFNDLRSQEEGGFQHHASRYDAETAFYPLNDNEHYSSARWNSYASYNNTRA
ncbi:RTA1 like protein-domain-containing protein [Talaromyces proteolyticus]|uniref:RTA1 like protein-domain-containing protein n=1 Tax=Talaromyces proteolyticus TaxID=1131652 RepID=A0AAD4Q248_9EURO|nr:RTA1 like protein-domain-containing protein [Talaromyces proteolyticus]KAH8703307.1 RTA1 like protein-domain-containing protein [Talaromyces proteolyticus]